MDIVSFAQFGYEGEIVKVEADLRRGIPAIDIVGLPDGAVREARERMRAAIRNSGLDFPRERILINLSPAGLKKEGSAFDLPIALAVLRAAEGNPEKLCGGPAEVMVLGELELSGIVRPVRGILPAVSRGIEEGIRWFVVPEGNRAEAAIPGLSRVIGVNTLAEAVARLKLLASESKDEPEKRSPPGENPNGALWPPMPDECSFEDIRGQPRLVRALEIAAAGGHNLIACGPPGCGKTLALRRFPAILPNLDRETAVEVTRIRSIAGIPGETDGNGELEWRPPFREPHQGASLEGMTGGGRNCRPGEISLAHGGVLFLDEAAQFRSSVLQALRAPLETGKVSVSRAGKAVTFPARFQLLMAVNPCPCGNWGAAGKVCTCLPESVERYWKRMSAPLLDRIDLRVRVDEPDAGSIAGDEGFSTAKLREEIGRARSIQNGRNRERDGGTAFLNALIPPGRVGELCALDGGARRTFEKCMRAAFLSGRGGHSVLKMARTIADLEGSRTITEDHVLEAAQFRRWGGLMPDFL